MGELLSIKLTPYSPATPDDIFKLPLQEINARVRQDSLLNKICQYELSCYLLMIKKGKLWRLREFCTKGREYRRFEDWVDSEVQMAGGMSQNFYAISQKFSVLNTPPELILETLKLGWSKAFYVLRISKNNEELHSWNECAMNLSKKELIREVKLTLAQRRGVDERVIALEREEIEKERERRNRKREGEKK